MTASIVIFSVRMSTPSGQKGYQQTHRLKTKPTKSKRILMSVRMLFLFFICCKWLQNLSIPFETGVWSIGWILGHSDIRSFDRWNFRPQNLLLLELESLFEWKPELEVGAFCSAFEHKPASTVYHFALEVQQNFSVNPISMFEISPGFGVCRCLHTSLDEIWY